MLQCADNMLFVIKEYIVACCSVLQCAALCCSVLQCVAVCCSVAQCVAVCCSMLQCVAVCCGVFQCVAVSCSQEYLALPRFSQASQGMTNSHV